MTPFETADVLKTFRIIADTREQWTPRAQERFDAFGVPVERATLLYGDYCGQIDLPGGTVSGLKEARKVLNGVEGIRFNTFSEVDVVRHELVKRIIRAYDSYDNKNRVRATTSKGNKVSDR